MGAEVIDMRVYAQRRYAQDMQRERALRLASLLQEEPMEEEPIEIEDDALCPCGQPLAVVQMRIDGGADRYCRECYKRLGEAEEE